MSDLTSMEWKR